MRSTVTQLANSMILIGAMRQQIGPHVSHAEAEPSRSRYDGQRCALLTTKSRNT
jgi:hypothetical protein